MEDVCVEGKGPLAARDGPSGHSLQHDTTTTNLLASVKEQVRGSANPWMLLAILPFCLSHTFSSLIGSQVLDQ